MIKRPLEFSRCLLRIFLSRDEYLEKSGDLEEVYFCLVDEVGPIRAGLWFSYHVLKMLPVAVMSSFCWRLIMIRNYLKIALRNIAKTRGHSFLNITGLAIGMACCLLLFMYVYEELTFDRYHRDIERVFRVYEEINSAAGSRTYAPIAWPLAPALRERYPQVEAAARVYTFHRNPLVRVGDRVFYEETFMFAEPSLFDVLTIPFLHGEPGTVLDRPRASVSSLHLTGRPDLACGRPDPDDN